MNKWILFICVFPSCGLANNTEIDFQEYINHVQEVKEKVISDLSKFNPKNELDKYTEDPVEKKYYTHDEKTDITDEAKRKMEKEDAAGKAAVDAYENRDSVDLDNEDVKVAKKHSESSGEIIKDSKIYCREGDCVEVNEEKNDEFEDVITKASSATSAGDDYSGKKNGSEKNKDENKVLMFNGSAQTCIKRPIGYIDCCSDKGWGKDINIAKCAAEDKALGKAKLNYLAHYLGEYCSKWVKWPGGKVCKEHRRTYCVFNSKMGRIVQEEGRLRHNSNAFGTAEEPRCTGITAEQFERLDVDGIDFINPVYPWNGGNGPRDKKAGVAGDIILSEPGSDVYGKTIEDCIKDKKGNGLCD